MSTLTISNLNDGTTTVATTYITNGSVKSWIDHSSSAVVNDSFNVSSLTDNSTGNHTVNLTSSFNAATSYSVSAMAMDNGAGNGNGVHTSIHPASKASGSWRHNQYS